MDELSRITPADDIICDKMYQAELQGEQKLGKPLDLEDWRRAVMRKE